MTKRGKISAKPQPDGNGHQVTYETSKARKVHRFPERPKSEEPPPHGAGSFHDPEHHQELMDRIESHIHRKELDQ